MEKLFLKSGIYLFILSHLCINLVASDEALRIFSKNKNKIENSKISLIDKYCFSVGKTEIDDSSKIKRKFALENSEELAFNNICSLLAQKVVWPKYIDVNLRKHIINEFLKYEKLNIPDKIFSVDNYEKKNIYYSVKAININLLNEFSITYNDIYKTLNAAYLNKDRKLNYVIYLELCSEKEIPDVLEFIASNPDYKSNSKAVILNKKAPLFPNTKRIYDITLEELNNKNTIELIKLLEDAPFYPLLCWKIGCNLKSFGLKRNSQIFFCAGTKWPISKKYNSLCLENIFDNYFIEKSIQHPGYVYEFIENANEKLKESSINFTSNSKLIINSMGMIPIDSGAISKECEIANKYYTSKKPDLKNALKYYFLSIQKSVNAINCNMIGNCLYYTGNKFLALPFFLQAIEIKPDNKDALINAGLVYYYLGKNKIAVNLAEKAKKIGNLSSWELKEISKLLNNN